MSLKRGLKIFLTLVLFHCAFDCIAQVDSAITRGFEEDISSIDKDAGRLFFHVDSLDLLINYSSNLAELFRNSSTANVLSNGPGNFSGISYQGLDPVYTRVSWHGVSLNAPSTGIMDLSLINTALFNRISLSSNSYPASLITLDNKVPLDDKSLEINTGLQSFDGTNYGITYVVGDETYFARTHFDYARRSNDFEFRNENAVGLLNQTRLNSAQRSWNLQQDYGIIRKGRSTVSKYSGHFWYYDYDREVPGSILAPIENASQRDASFKLAFKSELSDEEFIWSNVIAYVRDRQEFSQTIMDSLDMPLDLGFDYTQRRIHLNSKFKYELDNYQFSAGLELRTMNISSSNYGIIKPESAAGLWSRAQRNWKDSRVVLAFKQEFSNVLTFPFNFTFAYDKYFGQNKVWTSLKRIGRAPNYDALFLLGQGDPELDQEKGWNMEMGWLWKPSRNAELSVNLYRNTLSDRIQWIADSTALLRPFNNSTISINGITANYVQVHNGLNYDLRTEASITRNVSENNQQTLDTSTEFELAYTPNWVANFTIALIDGNRQFGYRSKFVDQQFVDAFNSSRIDQSFVHDLFFSAELRRRIRCVIQLRNFTNTTYFSIADYPMYGRNITLELIYHSLGSVEKEGGVRTKTKKQRVRRRSRW